MASTVTALTSGGGIALSGDTSGSLQLQTNNGTTAMTIDTSQNVGIGTTSPSQKLVVSNGGAAGVEINPTTGNIFTFNRSSSVYTDMILTSNNTVFQTGGSTERMRIDSSGNLLVGTTTTGGKGLSNVVDANGIYSVWNVTFAGFSALQFRQNGTAVGSIVINSTSTAYNTSSDYRLKENIQPMQNALDVVAQLNPVTYTWKADGSNGQGFIAHELQEVVPDCVTGQKDAVDEEGKPVYQGIDTSFLVATLTAAIQEQQAIITDLKARIETLEGAKA